MYNNEEITKNMIIRPKIDSEGESSLFVQLYRSIHYWKIDGKDIVDATKLVKELVQYYLGWDSNKRPCQDYMWIRGREPEDGYLNDRKPWKRK